MNKVILIGNITHDLELNETKDGIKVCRFNIAVNSTRGGEKVADFFNIIAWRGLAENVVKYCKKGSKICVIGELRVEAYEDSEGIERIAIKINAQEIEFLSSNSADKPANKGALQQPKQEKKVVLQLIEDDDIPFFMV